MSPEPPTDVSIGPATSEDADALADLWVDLATDQRQHGSHLLAAANRARIHEALLQHVVTDTVLVARRAVDDTDDGAGADDGGDEGGDDDGDGQDTVVGFVTFGLESERYQQDVSRGIVHNIFVRAGHQGEGIGSALLERAEAALVERGVDAIGLQAMATNEEAREFYLRNGYEPHRVEYEKTTESDSLTTDDG